MTKEQLKQLEKDLWGAADNLRANSDLKSSEYSTPVLGLIFLKFADNNYRRHEEEIIAEYQKLKGSRREKKLSDIAIEKCGFYLPDHARYDYLLKLPESKDIAKALKEAMKDIEKYKPELEGVLPKDEYFKLTRDPKTRTIPNDLLKNFANIPSNTGGDLLGQIYEYFLGEFARSEGHKGGEFFTPRSVVRLMVEIIEPHGGKVFDPACGSGGMFVQSAHFIEEHRKELTKGVDSSVYVYGQEKVLETVNLAKMNLAVNDRLETIAKDIVYHFPRRGYLGKGIVISLDKFTAVKMYDKVQRLWKEQIKELLGRINKSGSEIEKERLKKRVDYMRRVEMAVVVSEEAGEEEKFKKQELDIKPHRQRMNSADEHGHDIEYNFKDPEHPLQLVFVCAMWLTGFDAPTVSTLYLDKPQKDHTLMQSIARANRVTSFKINGVEKRTGEIVDYYNVFRNMKKALKDYAQGAEGADEPPVKEKAELFRLLDDSIEQATAFCQSHSVRIDKLLNTEDTFKNVEQFKEYADVLLTQDEWRKAFSVYENTVTALYEASKPEILRQPEIVRTVAVFQYLRGVIDAITEQTDIDAVGLRVGELLDESVVVAKESNDAASGYGILKQGRKWDLSKIDFEELRKDFKKAAYRNIEIADLRAFIEKKLEQMLKENRTRSDFAQRLQEIIDEYNAGGTSNENYFEELLKFTEELKAEAERHVREGLSEDELELFDLIKKDAMTKDETQKVKLAAKALLHRLREEAPPVLIQDWFKDQQSRKVVRSAVEDVLDKNLPNTYDRVLFRRKCDDVLDMMLDYASHGLKWAA
jgi:N-6 DNA Methylase/Domain of unknown function (DUF3387)/HsdM N-terminal domain